LASHYFYITGNDFIQTKYLNEFASKGLIFK